VAEFFFWALANPVTSLCVLSDSLSAFAVNFFYRKGRKGFSQSAQGDNHPFGSFSKASLLALKIPDLTFFKD